ncbi:MAG: GntR family transcriptional regulator [Actinomycetales bacterium]|nr:GntR family transcriptional regulator [Actinomycetales bacterium]
MSVEDGPASSRIVAGLRQQILRGTLTPGSRIRQEELAAEFGASRLPVRDALRQLEAEGLVRLVANSGAWVQRLSLAECTEVYLVRERIEPLLLRLSAPHLSPEQLERLGALADEMQGADLETFLRLDREFHLLSFSAADTHMLHDLVLRLWNSTQHYRRAFDLVAGVDRASATHAEHRLLVDALARGQLADAEDLLTVHIRRTRLELERHPEVFDTA